MVASHLCHRVKGEKRDRVSRVRAACVVSRFLFSCGPACVCVFSGGSRNCPEEKGAARALWILGGSLCEIARGLRIFRHAVEKMKARKEELELLPET